jgi:predicted amidohydrolase
MRDLRVATAQFENRDNDKPYNLSRIRELTRRAVDQGAEIVSFHEMCIPAFTWMQTLSEQQMLDAAEPVPDGPSVRAVHEIAREFGCVVMAGLSERDHGKVYNTYFATGPDGFIAKYRKLHPFVSPFEAAGDGYTVFELFGWKMGMSICYDNNLPENVRMNALLGAQIVFMPHVTGCLPSVMPGRGTVDRKVWDNRVRDPARLRLEFLGPKGRDWLMRWLPARAWENGIYAVFSNPIGWDYDTVKPGLAMILDPDGEVLVESHALEDDVVVGLLTPEKLESAGGRRYRMARRPEIYGKLVEPQDSVTLPGWRMRHEKADRGASLIFAEI